MNVKKSTRQKNQICDYIVSNCLSQIVGLIVYSLIARVFVVNSKAKSARHTFKPEAMQECT